MAGKPEVDAALQSLETIANSFSASVIELIAEMNAAFIRLLQKIQAGSPDLQTEVDSINSLATKFNDMQGQVTSAISQAKVEGL